MKYVSLVCCFPNWCSRHRLVTVALPCLLWTCAYSHLPARPPRLIRSSLLIVNIVADETSLWCGVRGFCSFATGQQLLHQLEGTVRIWQDSAIEVRQIATLRSVNVAVKIAGQLGFADFSSPLLLRMSLVYSFCLCFPFSPRSWACTAIPCCLRNST